jgi:mono/diheme cytochrome c family protein
MNGWAFACESSVNLVKAIDIKEKDGRLSGSHPYKNTEFLTSTDERFRPVNLYNAPDGSLYLVDMHHGIIQHKTYMTSYLRQQTLSRDLDKPGIGTGRIYRIRYTKNKLKRHQDLNKANTLTLVKLLGDENAWQRDTAQRLLIKQKDPAAGELLRNWLTHDNKIAKIHALWTLEGLGSLGAADLQPFLRSDDEHLVTSAAYAALSLLAGERAKLAPDLIALPDSQAVLPYKARALASLGAPAAQNALAKLLKDKGKVKFVREAAVSGLSKNAAQFAKNHPVDNKQFNKWLDNTIKGVQKDPEPDTYLSGDQLTSHLRGKALFQGEAGCIGCHGMDGTGLPNLGPTLDTSDWVKGDENRVVRVLLHGLSGPIKIKGKKFTPLAFMPGLEQNPAISDQDLADILTYARSAWSNRAEQIKKKTVSRIRKETAGRNGKGYTQADFE